MTDDKMRVVRDEVRARSLDEQSRRVASAAAKAAFGPTIDRTDDDSFSRAMSVLCVGAQRAPIDIVGFMTGISMEEAQEDGDLEDEEIKAVARMQFESGVKLCLKTMLHNLGKAIMENRSKLGLIGEEEMGALNEMSIDELARFGVRVMVKEMKTVLAEIEAHQAKHTN